MMPRAAWARPSASSATCRTSDLVVFAFLQAVAWRRTTIEKVAGKEISRVDYTSTMMLFIGLGVVAIVFSLALKLADARRRGGTSIESFQLHGAAFRRLWS